MITTCPCACVCVYVHVCLYVYIYTEAAVNAQLSTYRARDRDVCGLRATLARPMRGLSCTAHAGPLLCQDPSNAYIEAVPLGTCGSSFEREGLSEP